MSATLDVLDMFATRTLPRVSVQGTGAGDGWALDTDAIAGACDTLALARPVRVHVANGRGGRSNYGLHSYEDGAHVISVLRWLPAGHASRTLWHELEHARQLEHRFGCDDRAFCAAYQHAGGGRGPRGRANPFEVAARERERQAASFPLVRR